MALPALWSSLREDVLVAQPIREKVRALRLAKMDHKLKQLLQRTCCNHSAPRLGCAPLNGSACPRAVGSRPRKHLPLAEAALKMLADATPATATCVKYGDARLDGGIGWRSAQARHERVVDHADA
jgi:hypothetical protein